MGNIESEKCPKELNHIRLYIVNYILIKDIDKRNKIYLSIVCCKIVTGTDVEKHIFPKVHNRSLAAIY